MNDTIMAGGNLKGLKFVGYIQDPHVSGGKALPLYEPIEPTDRPSINTLEGWTALCMRVERERRERKAKETA